MNKDYRNLTFGEVSSLDFYDVWCDFTKKYKYGIDFCQVGNERYTFIIPIKKNPLKDFNNIFHILPYCTVSNSGDSYLRQYRDSFDKEAKAIKVYAVQKHVSICDLWERHYWRDLCATFWVVQNTEKYNLCLLHTTNVQETNKIGERYDGAKEMRGFFKDIPYWSIVKEYNTYVK